MPFDEVIRRCCQCGEPVIVTRDGTEAYLRCRCDWERGFHHRVRRCVHPDFWRGGGRTLAHWNPPLFRPDSAGSFHELVRAQKALVMTRLWEFCFEDAGVSPETGLRVPALRRSVARGANLFVRGPCGSGRGLIAAVVKVFACAKEVGCTPLPAEFSIFKSDMIEAEAYGQGGDAARLAVSERYLDPPLLVLENVRAERSGRATDKPRRFRAADAIDALLSRRRTRPGSLLVTSSDFAGQIGDGYGDVLPDVLSSQETMMMLMFHPDEAADLLAALHSRRERLERNMATLRGACPETRGEKMKDEEQASLLMDAFYYQEAFGTDLPPMGVGAGESGVPFQKQFLARVDQYPRAARKAWEEFERARSVDGAEFAAGKSLARAEAVKSCPRLSGLMSRAEVDEVGRMLALATSGGVDDLVEEARAFRTAMLGGSS